VAGASVARSISSGLGLESADRDMPRPFVNGFPLGKFAFSGNMTTGNIQFKTALRLIREWAALHQAELQANWEQMKAGRPLSGIAPLE
jgi:hypothetical protein